MALTCYTPQKGIDDVIAKNLSISPRRAANLRGMYDTEHPYSNLDVSNLNIASIKLKAFIRERGLRLSMQDKMQRRGDDAFNSLSEAIKQLRGVFDAEERYNRINLITTLFSERLNAYMNANPEVSRNQILNGYYNSNGEFCGGEFNIFDALFEDVKKLHKNAPTKELAAKYDKILNNWTALCALARMRLRDTEGLILGQNKNYAIDADPTNLSEDELMEMFDPNMSKRDSWQEVSNAISSFSTMKQPVRRFLSSIPLQIDETTDKNGNKTPIYKRDDLGLPVMLDPIHTHQTLMELLRGCTSIRGMINRLTAKSEHFEWLKPVVKALNIPEDAFTSNKYSPDQVQAFHNVEILRSAMFSDFKKNMQFYSIIKRKVEGGIKKIQTFILNKESGKDAIAQYKNRVNFGAARSTKSIYDSNSNLNWENLNKFKALVNELFPKNLGTGNALSQISKKFDSLSRTPKINAVMDIADYLDIPMTRESAAELILKPKDLNKFKETVENIVYNMLPSIERGRSGNIKFSEILNHKFGKSGNEFSLMDKMGILVTIGTKYKDGLKIERACRYNGSKNKGTTYYTDVNASYLGDEVDNIQQYVEANDHAGLKEYLRNKYLSSPFFMDNGEILNWFIRDLYNEEISESSFSSNFTAPVRLLGENDNEFENFTSKKHAEALFSMFFADRQQNTSSKEEWKKNYAYYPVFILGDSGVAKFIKAKRYDSYDSTDTLLDGFYDVYRQERRRIELAIAATKKMNPQAVNSNTGELDWSKVTNKIENFTDNALKYSALPFLNKDFKDINGKPNPKYSNMIGENPTKDQVKEAVKEYMKDAINGFKERLVQYGILDSKIDEHGNKTYTAVSEVFSTELARGKNLDQIIQDYYWNTKFATIQQIQLMTVDTSFYKDTKDFQKRYKEIHAPGSKLSADATQYGQLIAGENAIENCVYFEDIKVNGEESNRDFMDAILYNFSVASYDEVNNAIQNGITVPKSNKEEEDKRIAELKKLLGKNWGIYNSYQENTLTDGQGYRSLDSYRKVMIMEGKWDDNMEGLYNDLKNIRTSYGKDADIPADVLDNIKKRAIVFMPIKPYMYTLESYAINGNEKLLIPVQHKYAEAVLIPELLPKGSKLRDMAYWMEEHKQLADPNDPNSNMIPAPIDLVCSTKVVKVGNFGATDISKATNGNDLINALNAGYVHQLNYGDYRIQNNVPEHINGSQLFGTQVRKLIMANINYNGDYSKYTGGKVPKLYNSSGVNTLNGRNLIQFYNGLIVANILDSYNSFVENTDNAEELSKILVQATLSNTRESIDNVLAYALENGEFGVPLFEGGLEHDSAALIFSLFKKMVNKQKINGGSMVQVSAMGITGYEESGDLHYVTDPNNPKNILYAECEIPFDLNYTNNNGEKIELDYDEYVDRDGNLIMDGDTPLIERRFPGILDLVAYRIPTERAYSMINLKVKRFSRKEAGGTIKVPAQGTTISGFDFDIDKLYFMRYSFSQKRDFTKEERYKIWNRIYDEHPEIRSALSEIKKAVEADKDADKLFAAIFGLDQGDVEELHKNLPLNSYWEQAHLPGTAKEFFDNYVKENLWEFLSFNEYDYSKTPLENNREARNNMIISLIRQRLMDPETFKERYTPGGFANASRAARTLRELLFGNLDEISTNGIIDSNKVAKRLGNKSLDPEPNYDPSDPLTIITYNQQNQVAGKLIGIFANQNTNHAFASLMNRFEIKPEYSFGFCGHNFRDFLHHPAGIDVDLNMAEFLAASVDAVKDPVLNFLNLNTLTADSGAMLARLGYTSTEIGLLFNQPIIKEACEYAFNNNVQLSTAIRNLTIEYSKIAEVNPSKIDLQDSDFYGATLVESIVSDRKRKERGNNEKISKPEALQQLKVLGLFDKISKASAEISGFIASTRFTAANSVGSTFGDLYAQQLKVNNYLTNSRKSTSVVTMQVAEGLTSPVDNGSDMYGMTDEEYMIKVSSNPFAYEQAMYDMNRRMIRQLLKYYPYETAEYSHMRARANRLCGYGSLNAKTINSLHSDFMVYMLSQVENGPFNGAGIYSMETNPDGTVGEVITNRDYYLKYFAGELYKYKNEHPEIASSPLFDYLQFRYNEETKSTELYVQNIGGLQPYQKDAIRDAWADLMRINPKLGQDLFMYNFYKLGFTFSPNSFMNIAPTEVKQAILVDRETSYIDFLKAIQDGRIRTSTNIFMEQYILNHTDNKQLVYTPFGEDLKMLTDGTSSRPGLAKDSNGNFRNSFELDANNLTDEEICDFLLRDPGISDKQTAFKPAIAIRTKTPSGEERMIYYIAQGDNFNISDDGKMRYVMKSKLGASDVSLNYPPVLNNLTIEEKQDNNFATGNDGNTSIENEPSNALTADDVAKDRSAILDEIADELFKAYSKYGSPRGRDDIRKFIDKKSSDQDLADTINELRAACKKDGIIVLDANGNPTYGC